MKTYDYVKTKRQDVQEFPEKWMGLIRRILKAYSRFNIWVYKVSNGRLMNTFPGSDCSICIVTFTGAKSGVKREVPLLHLPYQDNELMIASQGGMDVAPAWYYNVKRHPEIEFLVKGIKQTYIARQVSDEEKAMLWPHLCNLYPDVDEYQARTDRNIPVFMCELKAN